jgi:peptide/nickel transport system ATP-binding protein
VSLLAVEDLSLAIAGRPILSGVALAVGSGEVLGVIGESGSGKSMTALAVMGLLPDGAVATGRVRLDGTDLLALSEAGMCRVRGRDVGMIFQEPMTALNPLQQVGDQVAETVRVHGSAGRAEARAIARATLARVGLPPDRFPPSRYPHELSGGQRQRVGIAMAIALRPRLLIADEPTTALDVTTQAQILDLLRRLVDEDRMALMFITHDLAVVTGLADRLAIMHRGRVVEAGATATVLREMRDPYTRSLFAASGHQPPRVAHPAAPPGRSPPPCRAASPRWYRPCAGRCRDRG